MRCIAFVSSDYEMGLTAAEMVSNSEHTLHKRTAVVGVHTILLHSDVSPPCTLLLLVLQQFRIWQRKLLEGAWACRLPEEDATGPSRHVQIRTMQDMCSGWLILHKVHTSPMLCTTSHH